MKGFSLIVFSCFVLNCNAASDKKIKASFDCSKASLPIEHSICSNHDLASLDVKLSKTYIDKRKNISKDEAIALKKDQRIWLKNRINKCDVRDYNFSSKDVIECLIKNYAYRISDLNESREEKATYYLKTASNDSYTLDDRRKWRQLVKWPDSCEIRDMKYMHNSGLSFYSISENQVILKVTCEHYAYQSLDKLYSIDFTKYETSVSALKIPQLKETSDKWKLYNSNTITGHFQFYPKDLRLLNIHKYSGAGQCGHSIMYKAKLKPTLNVILDKAWGNFDCEKNMTEEDWPEISL